MPTLRNKKNYSPNQSQQTGPSVVQADPAQSNQPGPSVVQPAPSLIQPPPSLIQQAQSLVQPVQSNQPGPSLIQPPPSLIQPDQSLVQPAQSNQTGPSAVQPAPSLIQPPPSLIQPAQSLVQPTFIPPMNTQDFTRSNSPNVSEFSRERNCRSQHGTQDFIHRHNRSDWNYDNSFQNYSRDRFCDCINRNNFNSFSFFGILKKFLNFLLNKNEIKEGNIVKIRRSNGHITSGKIIKIRDERVTVNYYSEDENKERIKTVFKTQLITDRQHIYCILLIFILFVLVYLYMTFFKRDTKKFSINFFNYNLFNF